MINTVVKICIYYEDEYTIFFTQEFRIGYFILIRYRICHGALYRKQCVISQYRFISLR